MVNLTNALTEKGNLKPAIRSEIRKQVADKFLSEFEATPKGAFVIQVAEADGTPVFAKVELSISTADNLFDAPKVRAVKPKETEELNLSIFD